MDEKIFFILLWKIADFNGKNCEKLPKKVWKLLFSNFSIEGANMAINSTLANQIFFASQSVSSTGKENSAGQAYANEVA